MKTIHLSVNRISERSSIELGERGENAVIEVVLDFAPWVEEFGEGSVSLYVKRNGDATAYPVFLDINGAEATWTISDTDTNKLGRGEAEFVYIVGEKIEKTAVFGFFVKRDIGKPDDTPPDGFEIWLDRLAGYVADVQNVASEAEASAELAQEAVGHYPKIVDDYWYVWDAENEEFVNTNVIAEGHSFVVSGTVADVSDLPLTAKQGTYYNVGTEDPYELYMYDNGEWVSQGTLKGEQGVTFTPSVSEQGVISWTNDGEKENPPSVNIKGPRGIQGKKGETGDPAGFGDPTATVDQTIGQASVSVSASGPDTAKVFHFSFSGIKGEQGVQGKKGDTGDAAGFGQPTASADANVGTPSVSVTSSGPDTAKVFDFQFRNIKGNKGDAGNGISDVSLVSTSGLDKTYRITFTDASPFDFVVHDGRGISSVVLNADYTLTLNFTDGTSFTTISIRGEKGEKGATGEPGKNFTIEDYVATPADLPSGVEVGTAYGVGTTYPYDIYVYSSTQGWVNNGTIQGPRGLPGDKGTAFVPSVSSSGVISWTNDGGLPNPDPVNIKGPQGIQGKKGETGSDGASAGFGTPTATVGTGTGTPSVSVTASGPDTAKVFNFAFDGLKGTPGTNGQGVPAGGAAGQFLKKSSGTDYDTEWDTVEVPTKVSDLTNDAGYITGMEILSYGNSTFADFLAAYTAKKVVYCRASSNSNPASGSQTRLAFMAYVNNADNPTEVEFQYYRSVSSHTASQQGDQVYVYKLAKTAGWTVTTREASSKIAAGTGLSSSYSSGTLTLNSTVNGIPSGGQVGQVLKKKTATDYDTEWDDDGGLPSGGTKGQVIRKNSSTQGDVSWSDEVYEVTITLSSNVYSSDKTFAQIKEAHDNGLEVVAVYDEGQGELRYKLVTVSSARIEFNRYAYNPNINLYQIVTFRIASDETVTRLAAATVDNVSSKLLPSGGTQGQVLKKASNTAYETAWGDVHDLPSGGSSGQVLKKSSASDYAAEWAGESVNYVTFTVNYSPYSCTADKTYQEVKAGLDNGEIYFALVKGDYFTRGTSPGPNVWNLAYVRSSDITFSRSIKNTNRGGNSSIAIENQSVFLRSDGTASTTVSYDFYARPKDHVKYLELLCDNSGEYQDSPTGTFSVHTDDYGDISDIYFDANGNAVIELYYGNINLEGGGSPANYEEYELVSASCTNGETEVITLTFRTISMRSGTPVLKTVTVAEQSGSWDSLENATVTYSEVVYESGGDTLVVNITGSGSSYSSDTSPSQIYDAFLDGKQIYAKYGSSIYRLNMCTSTDCRFTNCYIGLQSMGCNQIRVHAYESGGSTGVQFSSGNAPTLNHYVFKFSYDATQNKYTYTGSSGNDIDQFFWGNEVGNACLVVSYETASQYPISETAWVQKQSWEYEEIDGNSVPIARVHFTNLSIPTMMIIDYEMVWDRDDTFKELNVTKSPLGGSISGVSF